MGRNILQSSIKNASFSIVFQIFCRCITFCINAFIIRRVSHDALGIMHVRLLLLESTLLFLSKEAINRSSLSAVNLQNHRCTWRQLINQNWITVPIGVCLCFPLYYVWMYWLSPVTEELLPQYEFGCRMIMLSCVLELCAEAPVFVGQVFCFVKLKVVMDTMHIFVRSVVFIMLVIMRPERVIWAFGVAQMASILTILFGNYGFFYFYIKGLKRHRNETKSSSSSYYDHMEDFPFEQLTDFLPMQLKKTYQDEKIFNDQLQKLVFSFVKQGVLKQILTEGEKYVMSVSPVLSFEEQATYDVVNNMGSLAARFIFRPIEDSTYFYFTQTISRDVHLKNQTKEKIDEASVVLKNVCKGVISIGLLGFTFGQSYAGTLLYFYGGKDFVASGLPELLLRWHCLSIVLLAINGITEGYMFATNTSSQINSYNYYMAIFSVTFLLLSYWLTNFFGPVGFILANCTNMALRISYSVQYIKNQYSNSKMNPLSGLIPGRLYILALVICGTICKFSQYYSNSVIYHILIGAVCVSITIFCWLFENKDITKLLIQRFQSKEKQS